MLGRRIAILLFTALLLALPDGVGAQSTASAADDFTLRKRDIEWTLLGGVGVAHDILGGEDGSSFFTIGGRFGYFVGQPRETGFLAGSSELALEFSPLYLMRRGEPTETVYASTVTLLLRHYWSPHKRWKPFVSVGAGALFSSKPIPEETSRANFTPQIGVGLSYFPRRGLAYSFEYRLHHISNGGATDPNPGVNSSYFQLGVSFFR